MRKVKAIAVQAYGEGSERRRGVRGQKSGWRGMLGCKGGDDPSWLSLGCPGNKTAHAVNHKESQDPKYWQTALC